MTTTWYVVVGLCVVFALWIYVGVGRRLLRSVKRRGPVISDASRDVRVAKLDPAIDNLNAASERLARLTGRTDR